MSRISNGLQKQMLRPAITATIVGFSFLLFSQPARAEAIRPTIPLQILSSAQILINHMGAEPWRYGGASPDGKNSVVVGLRRNGEHGIMGEYALLDHDLRPLAFGSLNGTFDMPTAAGTSVHCQMTVPLTDRTLTLEGTCSSVTLGGTITTRRTPIQLTAQLNNFLSPDMSTSQYWLTAAGFSEAFHKE